MKTARFLEQYQHTIDGRDDMWLRQPGAGALIAIALGGVMLAGCGFGDDNDTGQNTNPTQPTNPTSETDTDGATSVDPTNGPTTVAPTTEGSMSDSVATTDPSGTTTDPTGFIPMNDGGSTGAKECDIWKQDCPKGQKCMPWDPGGQSWNSTKCTDVADNAAKIGDDCVAEGGGTSGVDNCALGSMCWFLDADNKGSCVELCQGTPDAPTCSGDKVCDESNDGVIIVCLDTCDPLAQSCPEGQICFWDGVDTFICDFDASGEMGKYGDPCAFINVCDYGLFCASQQSVPGCQAAEGCCSPYCNISEPNTCPGAPMQECLPWYGEGNPTPPGQENVGACAVPA